MLKAKLGFIGAGQMARAIAFPLIQKGLIQPSQLTTSSPEEDQLVPWSKLGCNVTANNEQVLATSNTVFWAMKPQIFSIVLDNLTENLNNNAFHVSIMAGVTLSSFSNSLTTKLKGNLSTARVMPNIGMKVDSGCSVFALGSNAKVEDKKVLSAILSATGLTYEVPDSQINAYCGLFGSGIGYMLVVLEALADGGVKMGIPRDKSIEIAAQTMKGAAQLVLTDKTHPAVLKDTVCSPFGTTIAGISEMERLGVRYGLIRAVEEATLRGEFLGKLNKDKS